MLWISGGREYRGQGAERLKALNPMVIKQVVGAVRWIEEDLRPEKAGGCVDVQELQRSKVMDGLKDKEQNLEINVIFDWEPMKLLKYRGDVINGGGSGDNTHITNPDQLKFMDGL